MFYLGIKAANLSLLCLLLYLFIGFMTKDFSYLGPLCKYLTMFMWGATIIDFISIFIFKGDK